MVCQEKNIILENIFTKNYLYAVSAISLCSCRSRAASWRELCFALRENDSAEKIDYDTGLPGVGEPSAASVVLPAMDRPYRVGRPIQHQSKNLAQILLRREAFWIQLICSAFINFSRWVRCSPRALAAAARLPCARASASTIKVRRWLFTASWNGCASVGATDTSPTSLDGRQSSENSGPSPRTTPRSMTLANSRTFPG